MNPLAQIRALRPNWEGLYSYDAVWDECARATLNAENDDFKVGLRMSNGITRYSTAQQVVTYHALKQMTLAHPINFGRAQFDAIKGIMTGDGVNVWEFLADYRAPFQNTYFDFSAGAGQPASVEHEGKQFALFASLIWTGETEFAVIPFGTAEVNDEDKLLSRDIYDHMRPIAAPPRTPRGMFYFDHAGTRLDQIVEEATVGMFDEADDSPSGEFGTEIRVTFPVRSLADFVSPADPRFALAPKGATVSVGYTADLVPAMSSLEGEGKLPMPFTALFNADPKSGSMIVADALAVALSALAVADACYFLEAHNVSLTEAPVSRQVRRAAQRNGAHIAQVVRVAATQVRRRNTSKGGTANFSHRFERRGYTRHVTKGSHAKADLVKPCYRRDPKSGELTCPTGCRREWVPPTVVGPEHLPFVPKSRKVPGPNIETEVKT